MKAKSAKKGKPLASKKLEKKVPLTGFPTQHNA